MKRDLAAEAQRLWAKVREMYEKSPPDKNPAPYIVYDLIMDDFLVVMGYVQGLSLDERWKNRTHEGFLLPALGQVMVLPPYWTWALIMDEPEDVGLEALQRRLKLFMKILENWKRSNAK